VLNLLKENMRPEFLNRIDDQIMFLPLSKVEIKEVLDLLLKKVQKMLAKQAIALRVSDRAKDLLADLGYDPQYGARPMKRVLQKEVINELSKRVLSGEFGASDTIYIDADAKGLLSFRKDPFEGALTLPEDGDTDEENH
jgi:ATP-dependent Clp protease ATP-binding subunit ClpB